MERLPQDTSCLLLALEAVSLFALLLRTCGATPRWWGVGRARGE